MGIVNEYAAAKEEMQSIIDRKVNDAMDEIRQKYEACPTSVDLHFVTHQEMQSAVISGAYTGCVVKLNGEW